MEKPIVFKNDQGQQLMGMLHLPKTRNKVPLVMICHGFNGGKTRARFVELGRTLAKNNIALFRFDFTGCGDSEGQFEKTDLFQEIKDLKSAYKFICRQKFIDQKRIGILAESFGAIVATLFIQKHPEIKTLVFLAPGLNQKKLTKLWYKPSELRKWKKQGYFDKDKGRVGLKWLKAIENKDFTHKAEKLKLPILIIQGNKDEAVPVNESKKLFKVLNSPKKIVIIKGGDHIFLRHDIKRKFVQTAMTWFKKYLK